MPGMSRSRGEGGAASKQQGTHPRSELLFPFQFDPIPSYNPTSSLVYASCRESRSTQEDRQEQEDGKHTAAAVRTLRSLPPISGRPAGPSLFLFPFLGSLRV